MNSQYKTYHRPRKHTLSASDIAKIHEIAEKRTIREICDMLANETDIESAREKLKEF